MKPKVHRNGTLFHSVLASRWICTLNQQEKYVTTDSGKPVKLKNKAIPSPAL